MRRVRARARFVDITSSALRCSFEVIKVSKKVVCNLLTSAGGKIAAIPVGVPLALGDPCGHVSLS